jgi:hypothetical protein
MRPDDVSVRLIEANATKKKRMEEMRNAVLAKREAEELAQCKQFVAKKRPENLSSNSGANIHVRLYTAPVGMSDVGSLSARDDLAARL